MAMQNKCFLPPLTALRAFEAAARHKSFKLAADELHVTPSAVSHAVGVHGASELPCRREPR